MKISIFVATHKKIMKIKNKIYIPLYVGAKDKKKHYGYLCDDMGENISFKNKNYCELTGMYWIWKNVKTDVIGLVHYRRYFFNDIFSPNYYRLLNARSIKHILSGYDVIVPVKTILEGESISIQYAKEHHIEDLIKCGDIIKELEPSYYNSFKKTIRKKELYTFNMMICTKELYDNYMEWLFKILFALENRVDYSDYDTYNQRLFGFLSERLFNVWLEKNSNIKIKEMPVYNLEKNIDEQRKNYIIQKVKGLITSNLHKK